MKFIVVDEQNGEISEHEDIESVLKWFDYEDIKSRSDYDDMPRVFRVKREVFIDKITNFKVREPVEPESEYMRAA